MSNEIDRIIEEATGKSMERAREIGMPWGISDLRAVAEAAYKQGLSDMAKSNIDITEDQLEAAEKAEAKAILREFAKVPTADYSNFADWLRERAGE